MSKPSPDQPSRRVEHAAWPSPGLHKEGQSLSPLRDPALDALVKQLTAEPTDHELDGLAPALAAFRARVEPHPNRSRRRTMFSMLAGAKLGALVGAAAAGLVSVGTVVLVSTNAPHSTQAPTAP